MTLWIWLGVIVVATVVELGTLDMTSIWFAFSGIVALILSACKVNWIVQLVVFVVLSAAMIVGLRPICRKVFFRHMNEKTNANLLIGKKVFMLTTARFGEYGSVKVGDVVWTAAPQEEDATIEEGEIVEIVAIKGNKLIVIPTNEQIKEDKE